MNATSESRAPLGRIFLDFCRWALSSGPSTLSTLEKSGKNIVVLETTALGMIALGSDNEAGCGNVDYDDTQETF